MTLDLDALPRHASALAQVVSGPVHTPGSAGYAGATELFNAMITNRPPLVVDAADARDVAAAIRYARENDLGLSVRGGGHGVQGLATAGELVINLAGLRAVAVDPANATATVGGGAVWGPVDAAAAAHGLAVPGGRVTHTGVAGLTLGGGQGWLSSKYGLTVDSLRSVSLITADGRSVTASAESEPELFWALRGGGGGFGAVTSFTFDLHPLDPTILGGMLLFPAERATEVVAAYAEIMASAPPDLGGAAVFLSAPPAPFVPPEMVGAPLLAIVVGWFGEPAEGDRWITSLRALGPAMDLVGPIPYVGLQALTDEGNAFGRRQYWTAGYVDAPTPDFLDAIVDRAIARPSPNSNVILAPMGIATNEADPETTSFGHREAKWLYHPIAQWDSPYDDAANVGWAQEMKIAAAPYTAAGTYVNVETELDTERSRFAFGDRTFARLAAVKRQWDPDNVFRHAIPVPTP